jgi:hypothetical protein
MRLNSPIGTGRPSAALLAQQGDRELLIRDANRPGARDVYYEDDW